MRTTLAVILQINPFGFRVQMAEALLDFVFIHVHEYLNPLAVLSIVHCQIPDDWLLVDNADADLGAMALLGSRLGDRILGLNGLHLLDNALGVVGSTGLP